MHIAQPDLPPQMETEISFNEAMALAAAYDEALSEYAFRGEDLSGALLEKAEIRACTFANCRLTGARLAGASFRNVTFTNCDFSAVHGMEASFTQCGFHGCKLAGANFAAGAWNDVSITACHAADVVFAEALLKNVQMTECALSRAVFSDLRPRSRFAFAACDLRAAEFAHTALKGCDFTTSDIDGLRVTDGILQGAVVTAVQACELARLLGVIIK